jgi:hypothetical protein
MFVFWCPWVYCQVPPLLCFPAGERVNRRIRSWKERLSDSALMSESHWWYVFRRNLTTWDSSVCLDAVNTNLGWKWRHMLGAAELRACVIDLSYSILNREPMTNLRTRSAGLSCPCWAVRFFGGFDRGSMKEGVKTYGTYQRGLFTCQLFFHCRIYSLWPENHTRSNKSAHIGNSKEVGDSQISSLTLSLSGSVRKSYVLGTITLNERFAWSSNSTLEPTHTVRTKKKKAQWTRNLAVTFRKIFCHRYSFGLCATCSLVTQAIVSLNF